MRGLSLICECLSKDEHTPLCLSRRNNTYSTAVETTLPELYRSVNESIKRVVFAHTNVSSGIVTCAALTDDDIACDALLATENLNTKSLSSRFATVLRTTYTFFMCHFVKFLAVKH